MNADGNLSGKVALVTGGTSGVGEASALLYAQAGARVVLTGRNVERGGGVVAAIKKSNGEAVFFQGDVTREAEVKGMIAFTLATYGRLDCAFNNAGVSGPIKKLADVDLAEWQSVQDANLTSVWLCLKYQILQMIKQGGGVIVNHASLAGLQGMPYVAPYAASKHGIIGLTKTAALEYVAEGIRINAVCSGSIDTPLLRASVPKGTPDSVLNGMIPMQRLGQPMEIAELVVWLSSPQSAFITGQAIAADGGESAGRYMPPQR